MRNIELPNWADAEIKSLRTDLEAVKAERDALREQVRNLSYTIRQAHGYLEIYNNDADDATHAKRLLSNAIAADWFPIPTGDKEHG